MILRCLGLLTCLILHMAQAQTPAPLPLARDLLEEVHQVEVSVQDLYGRREQRSIPVTVYRPPGDGPFPLVILNHGRASSPEKRATPVRFRFEQQARYFVGKGLAVMVPTRMGYGQAMSQDFDPESSGGCAQPRIEPMSLAASDQVLAVLAHARSLPFIDAKRWWVVGQSVGVLPVWPRSGVNLQAFKAASTSRAVQGAIPSVVQAGLVGWRRSRSSGATKRPTHACPWSGSIGKTIFIGARKTLAFGTVPGRKAVHKPNFTCSAPWARTATQASRWTWTAGRLCWTIILPNGVSLELQCPRCRNRQALRPLMIWKKYPFRTPRKTVCMSVFWPVPSPVHSPLAHKERPDMHQVIGPLAGLWVIASHARACAVSCMP